MQRPLVDEAHIYCLQIVITNNGKCWNHKTTDMHKLLAVKAILTLNNRTLMLQFKQALATTDCAIHPQHITTNSWQRLNDQLNEYHPVNMWQPEQLWTLSTCSATDSELIHQLENFNPPVSLQWSLGCKYFADKNRKILGPLYAKHAKFAKNSRSQLLSQHKTAKSIIQMYN